MRSCPSCRRAAVQEQHDSLGSSVITDEVQVGSMVHTLKNMRQTCYLAEDR
jgi:hypothetical protein